MKKKQIMALLLSSTLTLGVVSPVMAAESNDHLAVVMATAETTKPTYPEMMDSLVASLNDLAFSVAKDYWALPEHAKQNLENLLKDMPEHADFLSSILSAYPKGAASGQLITVELLQQTLDEAWQADPNIDMEGFLTTFDENFVSQIDMLQYLIRTTSNYIENPSQYWLEELRIVSRQLSSVLNTTPDLFTTDYLMQLQACNDEVTGYIRNLKNDDANFSYTLANSDHFQACIDKGNTLLNNLEKNLNIPLLAKGKTLAASYAGLYQLGSASLGAILNPNANPAVPKEPTEIKVFEGLTITEKGTLTAKDVLWKDTVSYFTNDFMKVTDTLLQTQSSLDFESLNTYYAYGYGNLISAYNLLASAIAVDAENQANAVASLGYTGEEKTVYDTALASLKTAIANKDFAKYEAFGNTLQTALKSYVNAAETFALEQAEATKTKLTEQLKAVQSDIKAHTSYYNTTYLNEVTAILAKLEDAPIDLDILKLFEEANTVLAKQSKSYSDRFKADLSKAAGSVEIANKWWAYLSEAQRADKDYVKAISITNSLRDALVSNNGIYDIAAFQTSYDKFLNGSEAKDGVIYLAAKSTAESIVTNAETVYLLESKKDHTKSILETYKQTIDLLKESIQNFDYANSVAIQAAADTLLVAQHKLLNDKPVVADPKPQPAPITPPTDSNTKQVNKKNEVHTGDTTNVATHGLLGLFSLAGIVSIFGFKRKK